MREMTMLMATVQSRMTTVNNPAPADLHSHPTRRKGHTGQVPSDHWLWFAVFKWIADLFGAGVGSGEFKLIGQGRAELIRDQIF